MIVAANDDMALGAMQVAQERGLDIPIIGFDALPEALASMRDGGLAATIEQFPGGQSAQGAETRWSSYLRDGTQPETLVLLHADRDHQGQSRQGRTARRDQVAPGASRYQGAGAVAGSLPPQSPE